MDIRQQGQFTIYSEEFHNDLLVLPGPCQGATVIVLCSVFMDYGHVNKVFDVTEEQYRELDQCRDMTDVDAWLDKCWPKV